MAEQWLIDYAAHLEAAATQSSQGKHLQAINQYDAAIAINDKISVAFVNRSLSLFHLKKFDDALQDINQAILLQPTLAMAYNNRGAIYRSMGQGKLAVQDYVKAIELGGDSVVDAHGNLATYYFETKQFELACAYYENAIALQPDYALTHWNYGMCLLLLGDLDRGWREYHWRWQEPAYRAAQRACTAPLWLGEEPIAGKTILLVAEQGFGDMIQFCRYASLVASKGARVLLEVHAGLVELCKSLYGAHEVFAINDPLPHYDFYCPIMSLPLAFKTNLDNIPAQHQYLYPDIPQVKNWQERLGKKIKPRVGLVWRSDPMLAVGSHKSIPLETFAHLLCEPFEFVSLQKNITDADSALLEQLPIKHFANCLHDFSDTAALCECMDLVVSVDTSVAHLAGALGKPVSILLHGHADWRWLQERSDSVWYPTAKLYRVPDGQGWQVPLTQLREDLLLYKN